MRLLILLIFTFLLACKLKTGLNGSSPLQFLSTLPAPLNETSGLARADDSSLYIHNDSGHPADIFQISGTTGKIINTTRIPGVKNIDWEELTADSNFLYVGDFGNNSGTRKDLVIYKINKSQLSVLRSGEVEAIRFSYPEQTYFGPSNRHNFDCEAMIVLGDSLYLFTKNRKDLATDVYRLPKAPGSYSALHVSHFNTGGLITAADVLTGATNKLALLGYEFKGSRFKSFLWVFKDFQDADFFGGRFTRTELSEDLQAEAIVFESDSTLLISNEQEFGTTGQLFKLNLNNIQ